MKTKNLILATLAIVFTFAVALTSCTKNGMNANSSSIKVMLTDGPGDFDAVNIDIQKVEVKVDNDSMHCKDDRFGDVDDDRDDHLQRRDQFGQWIDLNYTPGVIDVLTLRNGVESQLAAGNITGRVRKIRITLGTNNSVVKGGVTYPLTLQNETNNFLYIKLHDEHRGRDAAAGNNGTKVSVDFDIANSIVEVNGAFYLRPVLRPFCDENFAAAIGKVLPEGIKPTVTFSDGNGFNAVALPAPSGEFKIRGLREGTYTVTYAATGYVSQTQSVTVKKGEVTKLDLVTLVK